MIGSSGRFEVARRGTNGFHAFVSRNDPNAFNGSWPHAEYRDDVLVPIAFDDAGARAHMQVYFDMADLRAAGTTAEELKSIINDRYEAGYYRPADRAGISYMLAPVVRTYVDPGQVQPDRHMERPPLHVLRARCLQRADRREGQERVSLHPWTGLRGSTGTSFSGLVKLKGRPSTRNTPR